MSARSAFQRRRTAPRPAGCAGTASGGACGRPESGPAPRHRRRTSIYCPGVPPGRVTEGPRVPSRGGREAGAFRVSARTAAVTRSACQPQLPAWRFPRRGSSHGGTRPRRPLAGPRNRVSKRRFVVHRAPRIKSGVNPAAASMSMYSAPPASAASRMRRRSSSDPRNPPPSHCARQVTITGRPASVEGRRDVRVVDACRGGARSGRRRPRHVRRASLPWWEPLPSHRARVRRSQLSLTRNQNRALANRLLEQ